MCILGGSSLPLGALFLLTALVFRKFCNFVVDDEDADRVVCESQYKWFLPLTRQGVAAFKDLCCR